jgi:hypothetical protein
MTKKEVLKALQDKGYRGRYLYVPLRHPEQAEAAGLKLSKRSAFAGDLSAGLSKQEIARKYETSLSYVSKILSEERKGKQGKNGKRSNLPLELWEAVRENFPNLRKAGGYLYVPVHLERDGSQNRRGSGLKERIELEILNGETDTRKIAEAVGTTYAYVAKIKSIMKKEGKR